MKSTTIAYIIAIKHILFNESPIHFTIYSPQNLNTIVPLLLSLLVGVSLNYLTTKFKFPKEHHPLNLKIKRYKSETGNTYSEAS